MKKVCVMVIIVILISILYNCKPQVFLSEDPLTEDTVSNSDLSIDVESDNNCNIKLYIRWPQKKAIPIDTNSIQISYVKGSYPYNE